MFYNICVVLAIFGFGQEVVFGAPCNCGLGGGVDVCTPAIEPTDGDDSSRYPLVVRPQRLDKVDIAAITRQRHRGEHDEGHHHHGEGHHHRGEGHHHYEEEHHRHREAHHHHREEHHHNGVRHHQHEEGHHHRHHGEGSHHHHGPRKDIDEDAPLKPIGDLCTCGKTVVKPATVPQPACAGCSQGNAHHHHGSSHHHEDHDSHREHHHHGSEHHRDAHHRHGEEHHHHEDHDGHREHHHHGSEHHREAHYRHGEEHHHHSDRHHHNREGHHGSTHHHHGIIHEDRESSRYGINHIRGHRGGENHDGGIFGGGLPSSYIQVGSHGPERYVPDSDSLLFGGKRTHIGDSVIDYPICGLPVLHQPKVQVYTSKVPADPISKAIVLKELQNKQTAVEHLQFGTRTIPKEEPCTYVESKKLFHEESYHKHNGETLELPKIIHSSPVEEIEIDEEDEPEPEPQHVHIQPISYHSIGFVPCKTPHPKFVTPVVSKPEPIIEEISPCGGKTPSHCGDGYKSGQVIITNVPISSDTGEVTCHEDDGDSNH